MKYKSMYVLLLLLLIVLVAGRVACLGGIEEISVSKDITKKNLETVSLENNNEEKNIKDNTKTEIATYKETLSKEEKEGSLTEQNNESILKGDINNDGKVSITDISLLNKHIIGNKEIEKNKIDFADVNDDGKISITDISGLNRIIMNN